MCGHQFEEERRKGYVVHMTTVSLNDSQWDTLREIGDNNLTAKDLKVPPIEHSIPEWFWYAKWSLLLECYIDICLTPFQQMEFEFALVIIFLKWCLQLHTTHLQQCLIKTSFVSMFIYVLTTLQVHHRERNYNTTKDFQNALSAT